MNKYPRAGQEYKELNKCKSKLDASIIARLLNSDNPKDRVIAGQLYDNNIAKIEFAGKYEAK
uniref:Uncharacterized protein n=1 Tax=uncultured prokaryote TaxID=198431 RepID=A0A0H5Q5H5_9ZZZZ|nr:hypothetical protein [uncultured prokaryote]